MVCCQSIYWISSTDLIAIINQLIFYLCFYCSFLCMGTDRFPYRIYRLLHYLLKTLLPFFKTRENYHLNYFVLGVLKIFAILDRLISFSFSSLMLLIMHLKSLLLRQFYGGTYIFRTSPNFNDLP